MAAKRFARTTIKWLIAVGLYASGSNWLLRKHLARSGGRALVLTCHRVLSKSDFRNTASPAGTVLKEETFRRLCAFLASRYVPVSTDPGSAFTSAPRGLRVALTFDDGWLDTATMAFPIIQKSGIPATIFVCPELLDTYSPFWPEGVTRMIAACQRRGMDLREVFAVLEIEDARTIVTGGDLSPIIEAFKRLPKQERQRLIAHFAVTLDPTSIIEDPAEQTLTWDHLRRMRSNGVKIGSHTMTHSILTLADAGEQAKELRTSREAIEQALGMQCRMLAYPNGDFDDAVVAASALAGYDLAFTTVPMFWRKATNLLRIPRINISEARVVGPAGRFSRAVFEFNCLWKPFWRSLFKDESKSFVWDSDSSL